MTDMMKNVVVTGGTSGIGLAAVLRLLKAGMNVGCLGSSAEKVEVARQRLLKAGYSPEVFLIQAVDLRDKQQMESFLWDYRQKFGAVGALVHSAGISPKQNGKRTPLHLITPDLWQDVLNVNLTSAFLYVQCVLPEMMAANYGRIVMIGSIGARARPGFAGSAYVVSKAGLGGLARSIATEYASYGITANTVAPGNIATEMTGGQESLQNIAASMNIPAGRIGVPDDLSGLIAFLCTEEASFINGATIDVTGAEYISP